MLITPKRYKTKAHVLGGLTATGKTDKDGRPEVVDRPHWTVGTVLTEDDLAAAGMDPAPYLANGTLEEIQEERSASEQAAAAEPTASREPQLTTPVPTPKPGK